MIKQMPLARLVLMLLISSTTHISAQIAVAQPMPVKGNNVNTAAIPVKKIYDEDSKSWYAVYNTAGVIHVYLAVTDPMQQRKIINNGMELWIDTKGKKNKKTGILFPINKHEANERPMQPPPQGFNGPGGFDNRNGPDTNNIQMLEKAIALQREMKLTGFKGELNGTQNINHPSGIRVSLYFVKDTLVYDAQLPVNTLTEPVLVNSRISIGLVEKGVGMPDFGGGGGPGGDDGPGGDGGPPPGGDDRMHMFQDDIIWYKLSVYDSGIL